MTQLWRGGRQGRFHCKSTIENVVFSVSDTGGSEINNLSSPSRSSTNDRLLTSPGALPLSHRRLVGAKATKLQSWAKMSRKMHLVCLILEYFPLKPDSLKILPAPTPPPKKKQCWRLAGTFLLPTKQHWPGRGLEGSSWCQVRRMECRYVSMQLMMKMWNFKPGEYMNKESEQLL